MSLGKQTAFSEELIVANEEHLNILKQGVDIWNSWRVENPGIRPDLSGSNLIGLNLEGVNLSDSNLCKVDLSITYLKNGSFVRADIRGAVWEGAFTFGANFEKCIGEIPLNACSSDDIAIQFKEAKIIAEPLTVDKSPKEIAIEAHVSGETEGCTYPVWFATNRRPLKWPDSSIRSFSGARENGDIIHYGKCHVDIPKYHKIGSLGSLWFQQLITGRDSLRVLDMSAFAEDLYWFDIDNMVSSLDVDDRTALIFIHGFNVSFNSAALRSAQLGVDLKIPLTAFFSWPSSGSIRDYASDCSSIEASEAHIKNFLIDFVTNTHANNVNVIAHSMGNRALLRAIETAEKETHLSFNQIIMTAPDVDSAVFKRMAANCHLCSKRATLYCSREDRALWSSSQLHGYSRAGYVPPITIVQGVDTIEASHVDFSILGHGYYGAARAVLQDFFDLIFHSKHPDDRFGLIRKQAAEGPYWCFK
jgi:esterase/lipase superfamily enzyme